MVEIDTGRQNLDLRLRFFGLGYVQTYVPEVRMAIANSDSPEKAAEKANAFNSRHYLLNTFFNPAAPGLLAVNHVPGGAISVIKPGGAYTEGTLLVVAADLRLINETPLSSPKVGKAEKPFKAQSIYEFPYPVQIEYWKAINTTKNVLEQSSNSEEYTVFVAENCISERTNEERRTSKSIDLPHAHVVVWEHDAVRPLIDVDPHMQLVLQEQAFLRESGLKIGKHVMDTMSHAIKKWSKASLHRRDTMPFGYTIAFDRQLLKEENASRFAEFMYNHHDAYTRTLLEFPELLPKALIPQPSYRLYIHGNNLTISPEAYSPAGVIEAAGVKLERSSDFPKKYSKEELSEMSRRIEEAFNTQK